MSARTSAKKSNSVTHPVYECSFESEAHDSGHIIREAKKAIAQNLLGDSLHITSIHFSQAPLLSSYNYILQVMLLSMALVYPR